MFAHVYSVPSCQCGVFLTWSHLSQEYDMGNIKKQIISCFVFLFACISPPPVFLSHCLL